MEAKEADVRSAEPAWHSKSVRILIGRYGGRRASLALLFGYLEQIEDDWLKVFLVS